MSVYHEIAGTLIKYKDIKDFRMVQREYIYRPSYIEEEQVSFFGLKSKRIVFYVMEPYAAIYNENTDKLGISSYQTKGLRETVARILLKEQ